MNIKVSIVEDDTVYFILTRGRQTYKGKISRIGNLVRYFSEHFNLSRNEALEVEHQIIEKYQAWNGKEAI